MNHKLKVLAALVILALVLPATGLAAADTTITMCDNYDITANFVGTVYDPSLWCPVQYEQSGYTTVSSVSSNMEPVDTDTIPVPSVTGWLYVSTAVEDGARDLMIPATPAFTVFVRIA